MLKTIFKISLLLLFSLSACTPVHPIVDRAYQGKHPLLEHHEYTLAGMPEYVHEKEIFRIEHIYDLAILAFIKQDDQGSNFYFVMESSPDLSQLFALIESLIPYSFELVLSTLRYEASEDEVIQIYQLKLKPTLEESSELPTFFSQFIESLKLQTLSPIDQITNIHNELILQTEYDMSILDLDLSIPQKHPSFEAIGLFKYNLAVCSGYARAFNGLAHELGIPSLMISSEVMAHAWNMVYLEDEWLFVDVTFDDPVPDQKGRVRSNYLLLNEEDFLSLGKHEFDENGGTALSKETYVEFANYVYFNVKSW